MSRGLPAALLTAFQTGTLTAIHLVEIQTGRVSPNDVVRFTDWDQDIDFPSSGGSTFYSRFADTGAALDLGAVWIDGSGDDGNTDLRIPDGDSLLRTHIDAGAWADRQLCHLVRIEYGQRDSSTKLLKNTCVVEAYENADHEVVFRLASLPALFSRIQIPTGIVSRDLFPGLPPED